MSGDGSGARKKRPDRDDGGRDGLQEAHEEYAEVEEEIEKFLGDRDGSCIPGFGIFSVYDLGDVERMFKEYTTNGMPVYIIGATHNKNRFNETTRDKYVELRKAGKKVLLGQWTDENGDTYRDVAFIESGISREQAVWFKRKYNQRSIL